MIWSYIGGDVFRVYDVSRYSQNSSAATSTVIFDRFVGLFVFTTIGLIAGLSTADKLGMTKFIPYIISIFFVWILVILVVYSKRIARFLKTILAFFSLRSFPTKLSEIYQLLHGYRYQKKLIYTLIFTSTCIQLLRITVHYAIVYSFNIKVNYLYFLAFIPLIAIASSLPISIGGLGIREQMGIILFTTVGMTEAQVFSVEFMAYFIGISVSLSGWLLFISRKKSKRDPDLRMQIHEKKTNL